MMLRTLQDWVVRPRLLQVDGVADVVSYGGLVREMHVRADPAQLAAKGLTLRDLEDALEGPRRMPRAVCSPAVLNSSSSAARVCSRPPVILAGGGGHPSRHAALGARYRLG